MTASLGLPPLISEMGALDMRALVDSCSLSVLLRLTSRDGGLHLGLLRMFSASLGGFGVGLEALPSSTDLRLVTDEDDVHRCGRCQAEFTALEDFVQHKLQKVCQRAPQEALPATPAAAALLGQEVSPPPTRAG